MQSSLRFIDLIEEFDSSSVQGGLEVDALFVIIHADRPSEQLREFIEARFSARLERALARIRQSRPSVADADPEHPWNFIQNELERLETAWANRNSREIGAATEGALLLDAVNDEFDEQVAELEKLSVAYHDLVEDRLRFTDPELQEGWSEAYKLTCRGADDEGAERKEAWTEARQALRDPSTKLGPKLDPLARMLYAWILGAAARNQSESASRFRDLFGLSQSFPPKVRSLLFRLLSRSLCLDHRVHEAALVAGSFLNASPEQALEALVVFQEAHQLDKAVSKMHDVIVERPYFGIAILAQEQLTELTEPTVAALAAATARLRARATTQLTEWQSGIHRFREAEQGAGVSISVPAILTNGIQEFGTLLASSGPFLAGSIGDLARNRCAELQMASLAGLDRELRSRQENVTRARASLQTLLAEKDEHLDKAGEQETQARRQAKSDETRLQQDLAGLQKMFTWCSIGAAGSFFGYILMAAVLGTMRISIGPETSIGKLLLALTGIPILMATCTQIMTTMRTTAGRNESEIRIRKAAQAAEIEREKIRQRFEARAPKLRDDLQKAETALQNLEAALQKVRGSFETPLAA